MIRSHIDWARQILGIDNLGEGRNSGAYRVRMREFLEADVIGATRPPSSERSLRNVTGQLTEAEASLTIVAELAKG